MTGGSRKRDGGPPPGTLDLFSSTSRESGDAAASAASDAAATGESAAVEHEYPGRYLFRSVHPNARFGTTSDRYAGWLGQIYPAAEYEGRIQRRRRKLDGQSFQEATLPIDSVRHYFRHYSVLEIDYTFYRPLADEEGVPTSNYRTLEEHAAHAPADGRFLLKAPQVFFAPTLRTSGGKHGPNPYYLNAAAYRRQFHDPARAILGDRLEAVIFEQAYRRKAEAPSSAENVAELGGFFEQLPPEPGRHVELRTESLLDERYFDWLESAGIGHVFSHWTWLPPLRKQWKASGERITAANRQMVVRLLTPLRVPYARAYAMTHPFDAVVPEVAETVGARRMVDDAAALVFQAEIQDGLAFVLANNRAWGNAPELSRAVADRILAEIERRRESADDAAPF